MDKGILLVSLPAMAALLLKVGIFAYTRLSNVNNKLARLYLLFLFALSVQNIVEIFHFYTLRSGQLPYLEFTVYYVAITIAIALLLHLAVSVSFAEHNVRAKRFVTGVYVYSILLSLLFIFSKLMIADLAPMGVTATRVPGPLYGLFELYAIGGFAGTIGILAYGSRRKEATHKARKAALMLLAIVPMATVIIGVLVLLHLGIRVVNATIINPIAIGYFLIVTAYAIYNHRLFDIQFYIPWSKVRKRKTAFYARVRAMVAEIADLGSVSQAVNRLSEALGCTVVLMSGPQAVMALAGHAPKMARFPVEELRKIDSILVANEIAYSLPRTYALMKQHGVAAIVPFFPHSSTAASWMLLGNTFSDNVYTPLDFKVVEELFDRMGELFLDKMMFLRSQLQDAREQMQTLQLRVDLSERKLNELMRENEALRATSAAAREVPGRSARIFQLLPGGRAGKTLDEHVSEYEARIIADTLKQCGGNKSLAARKLGLRANTLHYKIERYGLSERKDEH